MEKKRSVWSLISPLSPFRRAARSLGDAGQAIKDAVRQQRSQRRVNWSASIDLGTARRRFEQAFEIQGWTEEELAEQLRAVRATKLTALIMTSVAFALSLGSMLFVPLWMLFFTLPIGGCVTILCAAQAFRYGLWEAQIKERAFIGPREYLSMPDFWQRLIG